MSNKIAILGPESTGKTLLCQHLSKHFGGVVVPEMSREYLKDIQLNYTYDDILNIAHRQQNKETEIANKYPTSLIFCDTEWITILIWLKFSHFKVPQWLIDGIIQADYVHYLLTDIDIPWYPDPLRQNPYDRDDLMDMFESELKFFGKSYSKIQGKGIKRWVQAINIVGDL